MDKAISLAEISDVEFGTLGTVIISGNANDETSAKVIVRITDISKLVPRLLQVATEATYSDHPMPTEQSVPTCLVMVSNANAFSAKDTLEPGLTLHTAGGTLQFHLPPTVAAACGKELHAIGSASSAPSDPTQKH